MTEIRIQRCLGRGGFGEVYKGLMSRPGGLEVEVAIKVLRGDLEEASQGIERLRDEGRLLGRMTHPTILRVYDLVIIDGRPALISEYVAGEDLGRLVREDALSPRAAFEVIAQVAAALDAAWSWPSVTDGKPLHLVHRDIKPDNIRLDPHGGVKVLDFGIAQAKTVEREARTSSNTIMGSTQYLAPERLVQQEVGPESDVFALGCTLFEVLTGEALFARRSMRQMYLLMVNEDRFEQFLAERCGSFRERLVGDRAIALVRATTCWKKASRPTAAEVSSQCDALSDASEGLTLTQWCRSRVWKPAPDISGPLDGQTFGVLPTPQDLQAFPSPEAGPGPGTGVVPWSPPADAPVALEKPSPQWPRIPQIERQWPEPPTTRRIPSSGPPSRPLPPIDPLPTPIGPGPLPVGPVSQPVPEVPMPQPRPEPLDRPVAQSEPAIPAPVAEDQAVTVAAEAQPMELQASERTVPTDLPAFPSVPPDSMLLPNALSAPGGASADPETDLVRTTRLVPDPSDTDTWVEAPTVRIRRPAELEDLGQTRPSEAPVDLTLPPPEPGARPPQARKAPAPADKAEKAGARPAFKPLQWLESDEVVSLGIRMASSLAGLLLGTMVLLVMMAFVLLLSRG